jgi:hypothetical protein
MARQKQIIADLKERGVDATEAERTLAMLSACLRVLEDQWLKLWKERKWRGSLGQEADQEKAGLMRLGSAVYQVENVRFGSKADIQFGEHNVR